MAESWPGPGNGANGGADAPPRMPRWVKISGLAGAGLLVVAVVVAVASGGEHGPGRHLGGVVDPEANAESAAAHQPPAEHAAPR